MQLSYSSVLGLALMLAAPTVFAVPQGGPIIKPNCTTTKGPVPTGIFIVPWGPGQTCEGLEGKSAYCCADNDTKCRLKGNGPCSPAKKEKVQCCYSLAGPTTVGIGCENPPRICHTG